MKFINVNYKKNKKIALQKLEEYYAEQHLGMDSSEINLLFLNMEPVIVANADLIIPNKINYDIINIIFINLTNERYY